MDRTPTVDGEFIFDLMNPAFLLEIISRRRWVLIISLLVSGIICFYLSMTLTKIYSASTVILIQPQRVPQNYVRTLVTDGVESRINTISQEIQSRSNLEKLIKQLDLFSDQSGQDNFIESKIDELKAGISVVITSKRAKKGAANTFAVSYNDTDSDRAAKIANALASLFINENMKIREAQAIGTSGFLEDELSSMELRLAETEKTLSDYRHMYMGELPSQLESNLRQLDRLQKVLADREEALGDAKARLFALLNRPNPVAVENPEDIGNLSYDQLQAQLFKLQTRYTDKHPDIIRLKKMINEYPTEDNTQTEPQVVIDTRNDIREYQEDIMGLRQQIASYERMVANVPQREQELLSLERDYKNMQKSYQSLLDRKLEAEIAVNMERKQKGEQFRIIEAAYPPTKPISPDTMKMLAIALVAGFSLGGVICFLLEYSNQVFRRPEEIETRLGLPMVATIPVLNSRKREIIKSFNVVMTFVAGGAICVIYSLFGALALLGEDGMKSILNKFMGISI